MLVVGDWMLLVMRCPKRDVASRTRTCACEDHTVDLKATSLTSLDMATRGGARI